MILNRILHLKNLAAYTPRLLELHTTLDGKWEPDLSQEEFFLALINNFGKGGYYFGDFIRGDLAYFAVLLRETEKKATFWPFYMNPKLRTETKGILLALKDVMKSEGFSTVYTQSTRTSSSYERWLEKFGAEKLAITYKFSL